MLIFYFCKEGVTTIEADMAEEEGAMMIDMEVEVAVEAIAILTAAAGVSGATIVVATKVLRWAFQLFHDFSDLKRVQE